MRNTLSFGTLPFHWKTGPTPPQEHTFPGVRGKIQQQIRPLLGMLGWANLPSLTDSTSFPLHPQVWGWGWGGGLPAKADLYQGLELSWVRGREPRVSPPSNQCLKAEVRVCLCQKYPSPLPSPSGFGISPGAEAQVGSPDQSATEITGEKRDLGDLGGSLKILGVSREHSPPSLPVALASLLTPEHRQGLVGVHSSSWPPQGPSPSRSLQA